jgi:hypothetical protein
MSDAFDSKGKPAECESAFKLNSGSWPTWLSALGPEIVMIAFASMAVHVRLELGYWPNDAIDSYPTLLLRLHHFFFSMAALYGIFVAGPLWLLLLLFRPLRLRFSVHYLQACFVAFGWFVFFFLMMNLPSKYVTWFLD